MVQLGELVPPPPSPELDALRSEVREFARREVDEGSFEPVVDGWLAGFDERFSRKLGSRGWLGMTWPAMYGGHDRTGLERFVAVEELLAAGAPLAAHWFADRQIGPALLRYGTEDQRRRFLPEMAQGRLFFAIGMSEPDAGSDLASVRTRAVRVDGGWRLSGSKVWTSWAHRAHFMVTLCRTGAAEDRHAGLSQLMVDLRAPGVDVRPITTLGGGHHFNEVFLDDVFVPDALLLGAEGDGWRQVTAELAYERSGPERYLSPFPLVDAAVRAVAAVRAPGPEVARLVAELWSVRQLSLGVALALDAGSVPSVEAALVKDLGTRLEQRAVDVARRAVAGTPHAHALEPLVRQAVLHAPNFTLRGGTSEILRSVVAGGLGL